MNCMAFTIVREKFEDEKILLLVRDTMKIKHMKHF